jgi:3-dehydro-4-phosphotetronate decarboxylase
LVPLIFLAKPSNCWSTKVMRMTESKAREEICRVGQSLFERGYVHATAGNISVRLDDGYLITPTDACLGFLDPSQLSKVSFDLQHLSGAVASKTIALHVSIYEASRQFDAQTACIIHTHSTYCVVQSLRAKDAQAELLPAVTPYFVMKVGHVPHIPYHRPGDPAAAQAVADAIARYGQAGTPIRAVMLARLGPNVWHTSAATAMAVLEELEETAKLMNLCTPGPAELTELQIQELRTTFGARW